MSDAPSAMQRDRHGPVDPDATLAAAAALDHRPADDLADVWDLLDALPRTTAVDSASSRLTATTVEMAALEAGGSGERNIGTWFRQYRGLRGWIGPAAVVGAALVAGLAAGRLTAPGIDARLVERLPYVKHLDLLREAGSVRFLEALAARDQQPPLRLSRPAPEMVEREAEQFRNELTSLEALLTSASADRAGRHDTLSRLSLEERVELEKAAGVFARLSATERQALELLAAALTDPARAELREAALAWHQWLQVVRPEDRERVISSGTDKRLEWIDWYTARMDGRMRPGFFDRPPPGPSRGEAFGPPPGSTFRGSGGPPGTRSFGGPRVRPDAGAAEPAAGETPAPPR